MPGQRNSFSTAVREVSPLYSLGGHIFLEPGERAGDDVALVFRIYETVAFVGIDHELGGNVLGLERVPELEGLWRRAFAVAVADYRQRRSLPIADEVDG